MVRSSYTFANDAAAIRRLLRQKPHYEKILQRAQRETAYAREHFCDDVSRVCGWGHNFTCPQCSGRLHFDIDMPYDPPCTYTCTNCGAPVSGQKVDEAWVYYWRDRYAAMTESAAICALLGDTDALAYLIRYVDFYADHYAQFPVHGENAGVGKITSQSLDEAVWGMWVLRALKALDGKIPAEKKAVWYENLFHPMTELLLPQADAIHNIPTWLVCITGMIGLYFDRPQLLDTALNGTFGIRRQIAEGFTADGIWHEGSMTYHYGTLNALTYFFQMYACAVPDDPLIDDFARLYLAPLGLAWDGFQVPALNDGWYPTSVSVNIALAARICDDPALTEFIRQSDRENPKRRMIPATLLYEAAEDDVLLYGASRLAVLKKPFHVILKSGPITESHAHQDHLAIVMAPFSDDIGTPGYASPLLFNWYRNAPSHNCVTVDGEQPKKVLPSRVERVPDGIRAVIEQNGWPDITDASRTLTADGDTVRDVTVLRSGAEHVYDWLFHSAGEAVYSCEGEDAPLLWEKPGYDLFENIRRMNTDGVFTARFMLESGKVLTLTVEDPAELEIYTARTPGNPADRMRSAVILRRRGCDAEFTVKFTQK